MPSRRAHVAHRLMIFSDDGTLHASAQHLLENFMRFAAAEPPPYRPLRVETAAKRERKSQRKNNRPHRMPVAATHESCSWPARSADHQTADFKAPYSFTVLYLFTTSRSPLPLPHRTCRNREPPAPRDAIHFISSKRHYTCKKRVIWGKRDGE